MLQNQFEIIFFYDEVTALAGHCVGCCLHQKYIDSKDISTGVAVLQKEMEGKLYQQ